MADLIDKPNHIADWIHKLKFDFDPEDIAHASEGDKAAINKCITIIYQKLDYAIKHLERDGWPVDDIDYMHKGFINRINAEVLFGRLFSGTSLKQFCKIALQHSVNDAARHRDASKRLMNRHAESLDKLQEEKGYEAGDGGTNCSGEEVAFASHVRPKIDGLDRRLALELFSGGIEEIEGLNNREIMRLRFGQFLCNLRCGQLLSYKDIKRVMEAKTNTRWTESNIGTIISRELEKIILKIQPLLDVSTRKNTRG